MLFIRSSVAASNSAIAWSRCRRAARRSLIRSSQPLPQMPSATPPALTRLGSMQVPDSSPCHHAHGRTPLAGGRSRSDTANRLRRGLPPDQADLRVASIPANPETVRRRLGDPAHLSGAAVRRVAVAVARRSDPLGGLAKAGWPGPVRVLECHQCRGLGMRVVIVRWSGRRSAGPG